MKNRQYRKLSMKLIATSRMTLEEKLATMEQLWDDLRRHQNIQSPDWHGDVLQAREEKRLSGHEQPMDWQVAKKAIVNRTQ